MQKAPLGLWMGLLASCGGDDGGGGVEVTGTSIRTIANESGSMAVPVDLSAETIEAIVDGQAHPGQGAADGSFSIANVPNGEYMLRVGSEYRVLSSPTV